MSDAIMLIVGLIPVFIIFWLANLAEQKRQNEEPAGSLRWSAYGLLALLYCITMLLGLGFQASISTLAGDSAAESPLSGILDLAMLDSPWLLGVGLWAPSLVGLLLLLRPIRRICALFMPIDINNPVHTVALSSSMVVIINLLVTLGVGLGNLTESLSARPTDNVLDTFVGLWTQQILTAVLAIVGVGWLSRRQLGAALQRLGIVAPSWQDIQFGVGTGLLLVPIVLAIQAVSTALGFAADPDVEALTEQLLGPLFNSPFGIITLGVAAALGEETLFRGAAQPRFGLIVTALLFALLHSNYGITVSTLIVFVLGIVLGVIRVRRNTTTAMFTHATYNMALGLLAYFGASILDV